MVVEKFQAVHHPGIESVTRMLRDLARNVEAIFEPGEFRTRGNQKDRRFTLIALVPVSHSAHTFGEKRRGPPLTREPSLRVVGLTLALR